MKTLSVKSIYGSVSDDGKTIRLQVNSPDEPLKLELPVADLTPFVRQLLLLAVEAGQTQGIPPSGKTELITTAVEIPSTSVDFGVASPTNSVLIGRCGAVNMALLVPHDSLMQVAQELKELKSGE